MRTFAAERPYLAGALGAAVALTFVAYINSRRASAAERANPPEGAFVEVDDVRLHYVDRGAGPVLVMLHGNGSMIQDFGSSGLLGMAAKRFRVIAFDRPGYGHSERPRDRLWTAEAQADLIRRALGKLGVSQTIVFGHSWGCLVAVELALASPELVSGLVLGSGYFYPTARVDALTMSMPAIPVIGDVIRYTVSPILGRLMWPSLKRKLFGPAPAPRKFETGFPEEMTFRPSQIQASAEEAGLMIPCAFSASDFYRDLEMPVSIVAGEEDDIVDIDNQSARLHADLPHSILHRVPGAGHMVHQTATRVVLIAIDEVAEITAIKRASKNAAA